MTVRTYYMPNEDWQTICRQGRALREAVGTLTGHAAGQDTAPVLDHAAAVKAIGPGSAVDTVGPPGGLPEPLAAIVAYLGDDLGPDGREFVPTAELADALKIEPRTFAQQMGELGCRPTRDRVTADDGETRQVRGYLTAEIRSAIDRVASGGEAVDEGDQP
jgi:S-DNA-T family DNA segregation ATPase FtsK/SpoIIIE